MVDALPQYLLLAPNRTDHVISLNPSDRSLSYYGGVPFFDGAVRLVKSLFGHTATTEDMTAIKAKIKKGKPKSLVDAGTHYDILKADGSKYTVDEQRKIDVKWNKKWSHEKRMHWVLNHFDDRTRLKTAVPDLSHDELKYSIQLMKGLDSFPNPEGYSNIEELRMITNELVQNPDYALQDKSKQTKNSGLKIVKSKIASTILKIWKDAGKPPRGFRMTQAAIKTYINRWMKLDPQKIPKEIKDILNDKYLSNQKIGQVAIARRIYNDLITSDKAMAPILKADDRRNGGIFSPALPPDFQNPVLSHDKDDLKSRLKVAWDNVVSKYPQLEDKMSYSFNNDIVTKLHGFVTKNHPGIVKGGASVDWLTETIVDNLFASQNKDIDLPEDVRASFKSAYEAYIDEEPVDDGRGNDIYDDLYLRSPGALITKEVRDERLREIGEKLKESFGLVYDNEQIMNKIIRLRGDEELRAKSKALGGYNWDVADVAKILYDYHQKQSDNTTTSNESPAPEEEPQTVKAPRKQDPMEVEEEAEQTPAKWTELQETQNQVIDRLELRSRFGIQGSDEFEQTAEEARRQDEVMVAFQAKRPPNTRPGQPNIIHEDNVRQEFRHHHQRNLIVGSQQELASNQQLPAGYNAPNRQMPMSSDGILVDLLAERLVQKNQEILQARMIGSADHLGGHRIGLGGQTHDVASNDNHYNGKRKRAGDVFVPVSQEGSSKRQRTLLPVYDESGQHAPMRSPFDRVPDHLKRYTHR